MELDELSANHEETDTKMLHAKLISQRINSNITIYTPDIYFRHVLLIQLAYLYSHPKQITDHIRTRYDVKEIETV